MSDAANPPDAAPPPPPSIDPETRVCARCGRPATDKDFCVCGANLEAMRAMLPTRGDWEKANPEKAATPTAGATTPRQGADAAHPADQVGGQGTAGADVGADAQADPAVGARDRGVRGDRDRRILELVEEGRHSDLDPAGVDNLGRREHDNPDEQDRQSTPRTGGTDDHRLRDRVERWTLTDAPAHP